MPGHVQNVQRQLVHEREALPNVAAVQRVAHAMVLGGNRQEAVMELAALGSQEGPPGQHLQRLEGEVCQAGQNGRSFHRDSACS